MTPKSLLRNPLAVSRLEELAQGSFRGVLEDLDADRRHPRSSSAAARFSMTCEAAPARAEAAGRAILRMEQLYPVPAEPAPDGPDALQTGAGVCWVQEEPENMGAWPFIRRGSRRSSASP